jgi:SSS family solute:Na+ symporter
VNLVQLVVVIFGFALALPFSLSSVGGIVEVMEMGKGVGDGYLDFWQGGGSGWTYVALLVPAFIISPGLLQKVYGARDVRAVKWGVGLNGAVLLVFACIPPLLGMIARVGHPGLVNQELALPTLLMYELPLALGALGLAAIFSAEVSSADALLFMLATSLSRDLYHRFVNPSAGDTTVLKVSRLAALGGGFLGVALAIIIPSVIDALTIFYALLSVSLFVPVLAGIFSRRGGVPEALAAIGGGVSVLLVVHLGTGGKGFGIWTPTLSGIIAAGIAFLVVLFVRMRTGSNGS